MVRFARRHAILALVCSTVFAVCTRAQTVISGTYNGQTISGDISLANSTSATFTGGTTFTGANATWGSSAILYWQQVGSLTGKTLTFGSGSLLYVSGVNNTLTLANSTTATGDIQIRSDGSNGTAITNQGNITHNTTSGGQLYARSFTNSGNITATAGTLQIGNTSSSYATTNTGNITAGGSNTVIYVDGNFANTGTLRAENSGVLYFRGNNTTANLGTVQLATSGRALLAGTIDNTSATLNAPSGGLFELFYGTIVGGTIAANAITFTGGYGTFDGATYTGDLTLPASTSLYLTNAATFTGSALTFGNNSVLYWQQTGSLAGKSITMGSGSLLYVSSANNTLTLPAGTTATGDIQIRSDGSNGTTITNQGSITHSTTGGGQLYARTFTNSGTITATAGSLQFGTTNTTYDTSNSGTVTVDGANTYIYVDGNVANTGTLRAQNSGTLYFRGTNTTANLGTVQLATGGRALINGTITNTSATLTSPSGGPFELYYGTIVGGTIAANALTFTSAYGTLNGATYSGDLAFPNNTGAYFSNGASFTGNVLTFGSGSALYWQQAGTLASKTLGFGSSSLLYVSGLNNTLTLANSVTATGDINIRSDGSDGTVITNAGSLTHNTTGGGQLYARTFNNTGTITATSGTLQIGSTNSNYTTNNSGTINASGSTTNVYLDGLVANTGTISAQNSATLYFRGTNTTANLGPIELSTGGRALLYGTLTNTSATLPAPAGGVFELYYGTIVGGTVGANALTFTSGAGTLSGVTYSGNLTLPANTSVYFTNGTAFTGSTLTFGGNSGLYWQQTGTLADKTLTFGSNALLYVTGSNNTLTLSANTTATGDLQIRSDGSDGTTITLQGGLTHTGGSGQIYARTLINSGTLAITAGSLQLGTTSSTYNTSNSGTITVDGATSYVYIDGNIANTGTLRAQNSGTFYLRGANTTANLGAIQLATGGRALLNGTLTNTSATLPAPSGGPFELYYGTIVGGTVGANALTFSGGYGTLSGVTYSGDLVFPASTGAYFTNGTTFTGSALTLGNASGLYWQQTGTIAGKTLAFGTNSILYVTGTDNTLTLSANTTATGDIQIRSDGSNGTAITLQGNITHNTTDSGQLYARTLANSGTITATAGTLQLGVSSSSYDTSNTGTVIADGGSTFVYIDGNVANSGTLRAQNSGTLYFRGTNTSANLGTVQLATGGRAMLAGMITNTSATLPAPSGGLFELHYGTIVGGTVGSNALTFSGNYGTLSGVTYSGDLAFPANTGAFFTNGTSFSGSTLTLGSSAGLFWQQAGTLSAKNLSFGANSRIYVTGTNNTLTLAANSTATGDIQIYSDGSNGTAFTNQGNLTHTGGTGIIYARTFVNSGNITATAGSLTLGINSTSYTTTNSGTITADGGSTHIYLNGAIANTGTLQVKNSGALHFQNPLTNSGPGVIGGSGTLHGSLLAAGGTIAPGNSIGTLTLQSGTLTINNPTVFAIELGGASSDQLVFQSPPSVVNLGTGLLTLSLTLLAPPTDNTSYSIIRIATGGSGITGTFANLPTSGSTINAMFGSDTYTFGVNYSTNLVSLNFAAIPEPSTYALLGAGLLCLALHRWRRTRSR